MRKKRPKAVIDTNLFVSGLISPHSLPSQIIRAWRGKRFKLITSMTLLEELADVLHRPKMTRYGFSEEKIIIIIKSMEKLVLDIPDSKLPIDLRDPKDKHVLLCAVRGKADYLVTGDQDLLVLKNDNRIKPVEIVTVSEFIAKIL